MTSLRKDDLYGFIEDQIKKINANRRSNIGLTPIVIANYRGVENGKIDAYEDVLREMRRLEDHDV